MQRHKFKGVNTYSVHVKQPTMVHPRQVACKQQYMWQEKTRVNIEQRRHKERLPFSISVCISLVVFHNV